MKQPDLNYLCTLVAGLSGIPVRVYRGEKRVFDSFVGRLPRDPAELCRRELFSLTQPVGYHVTAQLLYYGVLRRGETRVVLGPVCPVPVGDAELRSLAFLADVPPDETDGFVSGMKSIMPMPPESVLQILCALNYVLGGEKLTLADLTIREELQSGISRQMLSGEQTQEGGEVPDGPHNTLSLEQTLTDIVRRGDTAALREWAAGAPAVRGGTVARDPLRQMKNLFIVTVTLVSRAAIRGGLDADDALLLSDRYIRRCELAGSTEEITNLQFHMVSDYTARVERVRLGSEPSPLVTAVANYIRRHLSDPVTTGEIAAALYISRSHLSARFHREAGVTLSGYILQEKTEEAKRLLRYTDKPLSAISAYLGFSSQSHFSRTFRRYAGLTPGEYRRKHTH